MQSQRFRPQAAFDEPAIFGLEECKQNSTSILKEKSENGTGQIAASLKPVNNAGRDSHHYLIDLSLFH